MKYLKYLNENISNELTFELFQEMMYEITDDYNCKITKSETGKYIHFECLFDIFEDYDANEDIDYDSFLGGDINFSLKSFRYASEYLTFNNILKDTEKDLKILKQLETAKRNITKLRNITTIIGTDIYPKFLHFDNVVDYELFYEGIYGNNPLLFELKIKKT